MVWLKSIYLIISLALYIALVKSIVSDLESSSESKFSRIIIHILILLGALFWPLSLALLIINEKLINKDDDVWGGSKMIEKGQKEMEDQWASPPYCSQKISYQPSFGLAETVKAEFVFLSDDVERYLDNVDINFEQISRFNQEPVIHKWIKSRNVNDTIPTEVPVNLDRFQYIALDLIKSSKGCVTCFTCGHEYKCDDINLVEDDLKPSWNGIQVKCPKDHLLFYPRTIHVLARSND